MGGWRWFGFVVFKGIFHRFSVAVRKCLRDGKGKSLIVSHRFDGNLRDVLEFFQQSLKFCWRKTNIFSDQINFSWVFFLLLLKNKFYSWSFVERTGMENEKKTSRGTLKICRLFLLKFIFFPQPQRILFFFFSLFFDEKFLITIFPFPIFFMLFSRRSNESEREKYFFILSQISTT